MNIVSAKTGWIKGHVGLIGCYLLMIKEGITHPLKLEQIIASHGSES